ncbi:hypothetical protein G8759_31250 [Spirosoma aureum]|uniref:Uncharacterized protein n=1 Tax=Spirosoma aureum TaxID=2692134 RepID=A0A6G9AWD8_9BACT|nr:hypothetical protein [Spirosoma aureum]QIP16801.1 hypothetical protein G8759_31250 [Spirosoma aureum]
MLACPDATNASFWIWALCQGRKAHQFKGWQRPEHRRIEQNQPDDGLLIDRAGRIMAPPEMTARLGLGINQFHVTRLEYLLNYDELELFSDWVDFMIRNEFILHCQQSAGLIMHRIREFLDTYDFDETDMSEAMMKQTYLRYRKGRSAFVADAQLASQVQFRPVPIAA